MEYFQNYLNMLLEIVNRSCPSQKPIPFSGKTCLTPLPPDLHQFGLPLHQQEQRRRWYRVEVSSCKQQGNPKMASEQLSHLSLYPPLTTWLQPPDWKKFDIAWHYEYESLPSCVIITSTGEEGLPELLWHIVACTQISRVDNNLLLGRPPPCLQPNPAGPGQQKANLIRLIIKLTWVMWPYIPGESLYPPNGSPLAASNPAETRTNWGSNS